MNYEYGIRELRKLHNSKIKTIDGKTTIREFITTREIEKILDDLETEPPYTKLVSRGQQT